MTRILGLSIPLALCAGCTGPGSEPSRSTATDSDVVLSLEESARTAGIPFEGASGELMDLALHPDGGVVLFDIQANQVYRIDAEARFAGLVGSGGQGPTEYDGVNGLAVSSAGETASSPQPTMACWSCRRR